MSDNGQEPIDQVEEMLKKTGCIELHYKVQVSFMIKFDFELKVQVFINEN